MSYKDFFKEDMLPGGKGDTTALKNVNPDQLKLGIKVEMEHTNDTSMAKEIAIDHLTEDPEYYSKLSNADLVDEMRCNGSENQPVSNPIDIVRKVLNPDTNDVSTTQTSDMTDVDKPAHDPTGTDHITGGMNTTPENPNILTKSDSDDVINLPGLNLDIAESKSILNKMKDNSVKPYKRWTVKY